MFTTFGMYHSHIYCRYMDIHHRYRTVILKFKRPDHRLFFIPPVTWTVLILWAPKIVPIKSIYTMSCGMSTKFHSVILLCRCTYPLNEYKEYKGNGESSLMVQLFTPGSLFRDCVCEETDRTLTGSGNGWRVQTEESEVSFIDKPPSVPHTRKEVL